MLLYALYVQRSFYTSTARGRVTQPTMILPEPMRSSNHDYQAFEPCDLAMENDSSLIPSAHDRRYIISSKVCIHPTTTYGYVVAFRLRAFPSIYIRNSAFRIQRRREKAHDSYRSPYQLGEESRAPGRMGFLVALVATI